MSRPDVRFVRGTPTDEEAAAVLVVLLAASRAAGTTAPAGPDHPSVTWGRARGWRPPGSWSSR